MQLITGRWQHNMSIPSVSDEDVLGRASQSK